MDQHADSANHQETEDKGHIETSGEEGNVEYRNTEEFRKKIDE